MMQCCAAKRAVLIYLSLCLPAPCVVAQDANDGKGGAPFSINQGITGAWFNPATSGQGVLLDIDPVNQFLFGAMFTYEVAQAGKLGAPEHRWLSIQGNYLGNQAQVPIFITSGGVFDQPVPTNTVAIGSATVSFSSCTAGTISYALDDPPLSGSIPIQRVIPGTGALCQQLASNAGPIPDRIAQEQKTAFVDVTVIPMTDPDNPALTLPRQVVVVENGLITRVGQFGEVAIDADAIQIDGRGMYLGPGLSEMHLHIDVGGRTAAHDAGLLLIANGVTNVLNMGDGFGVGVPALGDRFESGLKIGPSLIAGNTAYGTSGGARQVSTPAEATTYANRLANLGYEFIKVYWQLTPEVLERFEQESERLGLAIVGHIPLTRSMNRSLSGGQRMAAHIQEPYVSFMNYQTNPARIAPAAQIFLNNGTYMTPTMAVFESYGRVYGGNQSEFDLLIARQGQQYTARSIKTAWQNFFNSSSVQGGSQTIGGYDRIYDFFKVIALDFYQAGVPLLIGTDGPGFPGVMSGFGVHVEMRLLQEIGLPTAGVYQAATSNAGQFVDDTLQPAAGFGSVAVGKRADLNLLADNPLDSLDTLREPLAGMARGRLWSRDYLQQQLDALQARVSASPANPKFHDHTSHDTHVCVDHFPIQPLAH